LLLSAALPISLAIALAGWWTRSLSRAGAVAATAVGTAILFGTGVPGMLALGTFFVGSSLISRIAPDRSAALDAKGNTRDAWQVLANGGAAAIGALLPGAGLWIVTASLAAAAADTWATSVGGWSRTPPRAITTLRVVPPGTSGGVTLLGTIGAVVGAVLVAIAAALPSDGVPLLCVALLLGVVGMFVDSLLGATLQGRFHCPRCDRATERRLHRCGAESTPIGGLSWLTNDGVNAAATTLAAIAGCLAWRLWSR
jgi:uncharacterized protein (TIGR00297 family)